MRIVRKLLQLTVLKDLNSLKYQKKITKLKFKKLRVGGRELPNIIGARVVASVCRATAYKRFMEMTATICGGAGNLRC